MSRVNNTCILRSHSAAQNGSKVAVGEFSHLCLQGPWAIQTIQDVLETNFRVFFAVQVLYNIVLYVVYEVYIFLFRNKENETNTFFHFSTVNGDISLMLDNDAIKK